MSLYILLNIFIIWLLLILGISVYNKYKSSSGIFFLLFAIIFSLWHILNTFVFSSNLWELTILFIIKMMYVLSLLWWYSMIFFIKYFNQPFSQLQNKFKIIFIWYIVIGLSILSTPFFISGVKFIEEKSYYFEQYGILYPLLAFLYLISFPYLIYTSLTTLKSLQSINKIRLKYIIVWILFFAILTLILLVIAPLFWVLYFENLLILTLIPFVILTFYAIHQYHFTNFKIKIWEILVNILSIIHTFIILYFIKNYFENLWNDFTNLWWISNTYWLWDFVFWLILFLIIRKWLKKTFLWNNKNDKTITQINDLKKNIPYITNIYDLNSYIKAKFLELFKIKFTEVTLISQSNTYHIDLKNFFLENPNYSNFINDFVFIEENKEKLNIKKISENFSSDSYLIFPLKNNNNDIIWFFSIWKKPFHEQYTKEDVMIFEDLKIFLEGHLKYIEIHKKIHDLSVNLDKQVDKQTIEYNQLINKQKEFISYVSHEVKGPIASSIFQIDSIIEEVIDDELNKKNLLEELHILNHLLLKTWELVNKLFSIQQFELNSNSLFIERVQLTKLLKHEVALFQKIHPSITFITSFDESITYIELDKVQFKQVIDNLINNAIKVINKEEWEISISCKQHKNNIIIEIEDNGKWFSDLDVKKIFDKYTTWKWSSVWLGMGLYLCKTIVELHWGKIQAAFWKKLWWAKFIIKIPLI